MKFKSPFYKRIISAVLALTLVIGCGFGTAMAADPPAVTAAQSVALADWNARTYDVTLTASSNLTETPVCDIVLVVDRSNSMRFGTQTNPVNQSLGKFRVLKNSLDKTKTYYYYTEKSELGVDDPAYGWDGTNLLYRMWYNTVSGRWQYCSNVTYHSQEPVYWNSTWSDVKNNDDIYVRNDRMGWIKDAGDAFIDSLGAGSRLGIVSFAGDDKRGGAPIYADLDGKAQDNTNGWAGNTASAKVALNQIRPLGGTQMDLGLNMAYKNYFKDDNSGHKKIVIALTDGEDNDGGVRAKAEATKLKNAGIDIYTIGFALGGNTTPAAKHLRDDIATDADHALTAEDTSQLSGIFNQISKSIQDAVITTTIDPRFQLLKEDGSTVAQSGDTLYSGGKVATTNVSGVTQWSIQWPNTTVAPQNSATPGWKRVLHLKAKTEFIGGNNITAATTEMSSVAAKISNLAFLGSTQVNVKPIFYLGSAVEIIFLGQSVPTNTPLQPYTLNDSNQHVTGQGMYIVSTGTTGTFAYQWSGNGANAATQAFPAGIYPKSDTSYKLTATFSSSASWVTMKTTGGALYSEPAGGNKAINVDNNTNNYTVHVKSGSVTITKNLSDKDGKAITDPGRSFVFLVTGNEEAGDTDIKPFYVTITMGAGSTASKTVTGLSKGTYTVKEVGSNWQYQNGTVQMNRPSGQIGYAKNSAGTDYTDKDLTASVTNKLISNQWFNATDSVTNLVG